MLAVQSADRFAIAGAWAREDGAPDLAAEVVSLMRRYAGEVVAAYGLCPHLHDVKGGFGATFVVLDPALDVDTAIRALLSTPSRVVHLIYPLASRQISRTFERFGHEVSTKLRNDQRRPLVHAAFHPAMEGGRENPSRLVGLLRRAPDPFLQFIPDTVQTGGTIMVSDIQHLKAEVVDALYARLMTGNRADQVVALLDELQADRREAYAPFSTRFPTIDITAPDPIGA